MRRFTYALTLVAATAFTATACGGSSGSHPATAAADATAGPDGVQQVTIDTTDGFRFAPDTIHAHIGKLRIVLTDSGNYPHNISFASLHATSATVSGNAGRKQATFTITLTRAGTYSFVCTFHSSAGMKGRVTV
jgi:plastocyanin